jgi:serine/threonine protein kinase
MPTVGMTMATVAFDTATQHVPTQENDNFGNYQVQRVLGEGGMGTVYRAEQTAPIRRTVALKVVKAGMDSSHVLSRFAYERQALAMMDHPHIARVYDANVTEKGRPFFVMEFVEGIPITKYCDDHRLNARQRLDLFLPICEAVQHAHQKGIIHRDLKPSNVLVEEIDGRPIAKVIDFGIAKAVDQGGPEDAMLTQVGQFVGTPEYMSPEQADPLNQTVDATSDVYSLGVMLYELLAGAVPFDSGSMRKAGLAELLRVIREDEAPTLQAKLTDLGNTATDIAQKRGTALAALRKELAGDLNWIVMKAVEKDRQRRYATAADLAADIRRRLENRPVLASPPSRWYRVSKFVRRNRLAVLAASVASAALIVGFAAAIWQAQIARRERAVAVQQRAVAEARGREAALERQHAVDEASNARRQEEAAERQRTIAESRLDDVSALANSMLFEVDDHVRELPGAMPAREVLMQRGLDYLKRMSVETPDSDRLRRQLGSAYLKMGALQWDPDGSNLRDLNGARESYAQSAALLETQLAANPNDPDLRHQLTLAYLRNAQLLDSDREQRAGYERALQSARKLAAADPHSLQAKDDLAEVYLAKDELEEAVKIRQEIVAADASNPAARFKLYTAQTKLVSSLILKDDNRALEILTSALAGLDALHAQDATNIYYQRYRALVLGFMGEELMLHARYAEGITRGREGLVIATELATADPRNAGLQSDKCASEMYLGAVLVNAGQNKEGMEHIEKALAIEEEQAAAHPENSDFAVVAARIHNQMSAFATVASDRGAFLRHRVAAAALYRALVHDHPARAIFRVGLAGELVMVGDAKIIAGDRPGAIESFREAVKESNSLGGRDATAEEWLVKGDAHAGLARGAAAATRADEAIAEDRLAIAAYEHVSGSKATLETAQRDQSSTWSHVATAYTARADYKSAVEATLKALPYAENAFAEAPNSYPAGRYLWSTLLALRNCYLSLGDFDRAVETARRGVDVAEKMAARQPGDFNRIGLLSLSYVNLGSSLRSASRRDDSLANYRRAATVLDAKPMEKLETAPLKNDAADHYIYAIRGLNLGGEPQEAVALGRRVIPLLESLHAAEPKNETYRAELVNAYGAQQLALLGGGMLAEALQNSRRLLELQGANPRRDTAFWFEQAITQAKIGSLAARTGDATGAQNSWRSSLELFAKGRDTAAQIHAEHEDDHTALGDMARGERSISVIEEALGDAAASLAHLGEAIRHQSKLVDSDPSNQAAARRLRDLKAQRSRLEPLAEGEHSTGGTEEVSRGWEQYADALGIIAYALPPRLEAAQKAVDLSRRAADSRAAAQVDLAEALQQLGSFQLERALFAQGAERASALHAAEQSQSEARRILSTLQQSGALSETGRTVMSDAVIGLGTIAARLSEAGVSNQ